MKRLQKKKGSKRPAAGSQSPLRNHCLEKDFGFRKHVRERSANTGLVWSASDHNTSKSMATMGEDLCFSLFLQIRLRCRYFRIENQSSNWQHEAHRKPNYDAMLSFTMAEIVE